MMVRQLLFAVTSLVLLTSCRGQPADIVDSTRTEGAAGSDVVEAVVDIIKSRCIFSEDRLFLRRLAYVESRDGNDPDTYRAGYNGGIWKVAQGMFAATNTCPGVLRSTCDLIQTELGIDWTRVNYTDLRKPLYSALAAVLYLETRLGNPPAIPATIEQQADTWSHYYHFGTPVRNYTVMAEQATDFQCGDMDLVFIIDSSGSITDPDFALGLDFVAKVAEAFDIPSKVRVATIIYESDASVVFSFNSHSTKSQVLSAIRGITRGTGGTATDAALDLARTNVFTTAGGARPGVKRVAVLVTDGQSYDPASTAISARNLRDMSGMGVTVFSVGVGGYDVDELHAVASDPPCSHTYTLSDFSVIESILFEIQRDTCRAQATIPNHGTLVIDPQGPSRISTNPGTLEIVAYCSTANVYVSYTNPNPSPAMYAELLTATAGQPAYFIAQNSGTGRPVYLTVVGSRLSPTEAELNNCTGGRIEVTNTDTTMQVQCCVNRECAPCTSLQLQQIPGIRDIVCGYRDFHNPCSREAMASGHVVFAYPYDATKFIRCDYAGQAYVTQCPIGLTFNPNTLTCGHTSGSGVGNRVRLPADVYNPCTPAHIQAQYFYFEYSPDRRMFIHCDLFGDAFLEQCPVLEVWSQELLTCIADRPNFVYQTTTRGPTFINPCTPQALAAGIMYHLYPCDHTRFIHCDTNGNYWVQFCPGGMYYNPDAYICVLGDPQHGDHGCD